MASKKTIDYNIEVICFSCFSLANGVFSPHPFILNHKAGFRSVSVVFGDVSVFGIWPVNFHGER